MNGPETAHYNMILAPEIATELGFLLREKKQKSEAAVIYKAMAAKLDSQNNPKAAYFKSQLADL